MRKFLAWLLFVLVIYAIQSSFLSLVYFHGIGPDMLLLMTCSVGFLKGKKLGAFYGFLFGLFGDVASSKVALISAPGLRRCSRPKCRHFHSKKS